MQKLRNCTGQGSPGKVELNGKFHPRCPRAVSLESYEGRYLVKLYFDCSEGNVQPFPGPVTQQTALLTDIFAFIDNEVVRAKNRQHKQRNAERAQAESLHKR